MADRKLTVADLVAGLTDIRLPVEAPGGQLAEILAAVGLGLLLAVCIGALIPLVTRRVAKVKPPGLQEQIANARALPHDERVIALLHLLKEHNSQAADRLMRTIYSPAGLPDPSALEAQLTGAER